MPYIIAIDEPDGTVFYAGPLNPPVSFVEQADRYEALPADLEVLQARGVNAHVEVVP